MGYCIALINKETGNYELSTNKSTGWLNIITDKEEALETLRDELKQHGTRGVRLLEMISFKVKTEITLEE